MRTNKCAFCEEYKKQLDIGEIEKEHGYKMHLRACLFVKSTTTGDRPHYSTYSRPMVLRYCPSCGRNLNSDENLAR